MNPAEYYHVLNRGNNRDNIHPFLKTWQRKLFSQTVPEIPFSIIGYICLLSIAKSFSLVGSGQIGGGDSWRGGQHRHSRFQKPGMSRQAWRLDRCRQCHHRNGQWAIPTILPVFRVGTPTAKNELKTAKTGHEKRVAIVHPKWLWMSKFCNNFEYLFTT